MSEFSSEAHVVDRTHKILPSKFNLIIFLQLPVFLFSLQSDLTVILYCYFTSVMLYSGLSIIIFDPENIYRSELEAYVKYNEIKLLQVHCMVVTEMNWFKS